ncbi:MAG: hypothetical protein L6R41_007917 [Letrouitia leprolyta]|nr:MAG: hypothetical protein L6R41_007917 [Letrouitia leprolyta]
MSRNERGSESTGDSQSSIARTFSSDLNNAFSIDKDLSGLVQSVEQKKQALSSQSQELEAIEAKLRETEERLREKQSNPTAKRKADARPEQTHNTSVAPITPSEEHPSGSTAGQAPSASTMSYWRPSMPGTFAETPGDARQTSYMGERPDKT